MNELNNEIDLILHDIFEFLQLKKANYFPKMLNKIFAIEKNNVEEFLQALNSNDLWGGSGSLADCALNDCQNGISEADAQFFYAQMIKLGEYIIENVPNSNPRIPSWLEFFRWSSD